MQGKKIVSVLMGRRTTWVWILGALLVALAAASCYAENCNKFTAPSTCGDEAYNCLDDGGGAACNHAETGAPYNCCCEAVSGGSDLGCCNYRCWTVDCWHLIDPGFQCAHLTLRNQGVFKEDWDCPGDQCADPDP